MNCLRVTIHFRSGERLVAWVGPKAIGGDDDARD